MSTDTLKVCSICEKEKLYTEYHIRKASPDGYNASCKSCRSAIRKTYKSQKIYNKKRYWENPKKSRELKRAWELKNTDHIKKYKTHYRKKEPLKHRVWDALKSTKRKQRVPSWLSNEHKKEIEKFYWLAKDLRAVTGEEYQVDHIVPLLGKRVCGLHVPWNLQVLPADLNNKKNNRWEETSTTKTYGNIQ
jgi:hypothetical protein